MEKHGFKIEKVSSSGGSSYRINGTRLCINKGPAPRYRHPQEWDVVATDDEFTDLPLVTGYSLDNALYRLAKLRDLLGKGA